MKEEMQGRGSGKVRDFALYGETTGETDEFGLPVRYNWAAEYRGRGDGRLRPHAGARAGMAQPHDQHRHRLRLRREADRAALSGEGVGLRAGGADLLRAGASRSCRRTAGAGAVAPSSSTTTCSTSRTCIGQAHHRHPPARQRHHPRGERHGRAGGDEPLRRQPEVADLPAAHDVAVETSGSRGLLEHPARGVRLLPPSGRRPRWSARRSTWGRARWSIVCRDEDAARAALRRGRTRGIGIVYTRTGRRFFDDAALETRASWPASAPPSTAAGFWDEFETDWVCLDCELMPWSAKAQELLQAASTPRSARAGRAALAEAVERAEPGGARSGADVAPRCWTRYRRAAAPWRALTSQAYRRYCWPVNSLDDLKLAPFHLLATEGHGPRRPGPRLAHGHAGQVCAARHRAAAGHAVPGGRRDRPGQRGSRASLVGGTDRARRRGHGGQAAGLHRHGASAAWSSRP